MTVRVIWYFIIDIVKVILFAEADLEKSVLGAGLLLCPSLSLLPFLFPRIIEVVIRRCSSKMLFLKISHISQENT